MLDEKQREDAGKVTITLQIITAAMAFGIVVFAGVVLGVLRDDQLAEQEIQPLITYVAAGFGILSLATSVIFLRLLDVGNRQKLLSSEQTLSQHSSPTAEVGEVDLLMGMYQVRHIVGIAIFEGAAFFSLIAYMLEGQTVSLVMAAVLLIAIVFKFPTQNGIENWIATERKTVEELRSLKSVGTDKPRADGTHVSEPVAV